MTKIDEAIETIQKECERLAECNKSLKDENDRLKSEHYKDSELSAMKKSEKKLSYRLRHYGLDEKDWAELDAWWKEHLKEDHRCELETDKKYVTKASLVPSHHIEIHEFAECICYSVVCEKCKKSHSVYL